MVTRQPIRMGVLSELLLGDGAAAEEIRRKHEGFCRKLNNRKENDMLSYLCYRSLVLLSW